MNLPDQSQCAEPDSYRRVAESFIAFFYAATLDIVLTHYYLKTPDQQSVSWACLAFVLFLGSDWSSKARVTYVIPANERFPGTRFLWKSILELFMIFLLIDVAIRFLGHEPFPHFATQFAFFAIASGIWDALLLHTVTLTFRQLLGLFWRGGVDVNSAASTYTPRFVDARTRLNQWADDSKTGINRRISTLQANQESLPASFAIVLLQMRCRNIRLLQGVLRGSTALIAHIVVVHLLFANWATGLILLVRVHGPYLLPAVPLSSSHTIAFAFVLLAALAACYSRSWRRFASALLCASMLATYLLVPPRALFFILIIQQVAVSTFFHLSAQRGPSRGHAALQARV